MYLLFLQTEVEGQSAGLSNLQLAGFLGAQASPLAGCGRHQWWVVLLPSITAVPI